MKKIRTYKLLKQNFGIEPFLENLIDKDFRRCLCSFRILTFFVFIFNINGLLIIYVYHNYDQL